MTENNNQQLEQMGRAAELHREEWQTVTRMQSQTQTRATAGVTCPECGAENDAEAQYCASCGAWLGRQTCPFCNNPTDQDADYCESCHRYIRQDVCSFCGARMSANDTFCPECGQPRSGIKCPVCNTMNEFSFCKQCGQPLTAEAKAMRERMMQMPEYQELRLLAREYEDLQSQLPFTSEQDRQRDAASQELRKRILTLLAEDEGVKDFVAPPPTRRRCSIEELNQRKQQKLERLSQILDKLTAPPMASAVKVRNFAMAQKPAGVRLAWQCNYKHALHSSPCGCAKPQLGGKWMVLGHHSNKEIRDDK